MPRDPEIRTTLELQPILPLNQWWQLGLGLLALLALVALSLALLRRDTVALPLPLRLALATLQLVALACLVVFFLNPGLRTHQPIVTDSRLAVLIDTSLSMGLSDPVAAGDPLPTRLEQVRQWLASSAELQRLNEDHEVVLYRFGGSQPPETLVTLPKIGEVELQAGEAAARRLSQQQLSLPWWIAGLSLFVVWLGLLLGWSAGWFLASWRPLQGVLLGSWLVASLSMLIVLGCSDLQNPEWPLVRSWGLAPDGPEDGLPPAAEPADALTNAPDWEDVLQPQATSTAVGDAVDFVLNQNRGLPLAGIVLLTDGQSNRGRSLRAASTACRNADIPLLPVGLGSNQPRRNLRLVEVAAPPRVLPGDRFQIKAVIQAVGFAGASTRLRITSVDRAGQEAERVEADTPLELDAGEEPLAVTLELPAGEPSERLYQVELIPLAGEQDPSDNRRSTLIEIVDRPIRVLLIAGGPNREFRFLRNQLFRDPEVRLDVWLQSASAGADQEADQLLEAFPGTAAELAVYDCLIAFDPDWRLLDASQAEVLERWVAEQAGGMLLIAGPVNTPEWTRRPRGDEGIDQIRRLYPVSFFSQGTAQLKLGRFGGERPFPLDFTREGRAASFLWLGDTAEQSQQTWGQFEGVYGYYAVSEPKPGANVLARFADPATAIEGNLPIYLANQFYGAGRVFFQASAEMWRVRRVDVEHFETYYRQLIRWIAQGRLLRDSSQGVLFTDREECWLGDPVQVRAILRDAQGDPLLAAQVEGTVQLPSGDSRPLVLLPEGNASRAGTFLGVFQANQEGEYRLRVAVPESPTLDVLTRAVRVSVPDLERRRAERNDTALQELAEQTGGHYYAGLGLFDSSSAGPTAPVNLLVPRDRQAFLAGTLSRPFTVKLMSWLLVWLAVAMCLHWTTRRLHKLS